MKKIGTHNSLSYHRPQWWLRWLNFTSKCQNLTIEQQYDLGVRWFDFRIRFTSNGVRSAHGLMTYKPDFDSLFYFLDKKGDAIVNVVLENHVWDFGKHDEKFMQHIYKLLTKYQNITFVGGNKKRPWEKLYPLGDVATRTCFETYEGKQKKFPWPLWYAKRKNAGYWRGVDNDIFSVFDFVELK